MYYPADMTREDIESFELDMAALTIREEELECNWELQQAAEDAMISEHSDQFDIMVCEICISCEDVYGYH